MFSTFHEAARRRAASGPRRGILVAVSLLLWLAPQALAQNTFSSGSTGADGAFEPTTNQTIVVPDSGVLNYTTVNIPTGITVTFVRNAKNKPVTILASGNVIIAGTISVDGKTANSSGGFGTGGPGGFDGAAGGFPFDASLTGATGDGPGGGGGGAGGTSPGGGGGGSYASSGNNGASSTGQTPGATGPRYGSVTLVPLVGGSGGGGGGATTSRTGGAGGGGGGAILIASSGSISFTGIINARGGTGGSGAGGGGGGAGGSIRFVANTITGAGTLRAAGANAGTAVVGHSGGKGGDGFIRVEANDYASFNPSTDPIAVSFSLPHPVTTTSAPALRIASVAGISAPASPLGSLHGVPDVVVPTTQPNPVTVAIEASNVPVGTVATVTLTPAQGARSTAQSSALAGTDTASTASASVNLPAGMSVITATAIIDLTTQSAAARPPVYIDGERVTRIEVAATFGGPSEVTYVTDSGRRIKRTSE